MNNRPQQEVAAVNAAIMGQAAIDSAFVEALSSLVGLPIPEVRSVLRASLRGVDSVIEGYEIRTGVWRLDLNAALAKAVACGTVTTLLLRGLGADTIPATVLSIIAPLLFELERVEVSADDLVVHAYLAEAVGADTVTLTEMYERLPDGVRAELPVREFAGIVEKLLASRLITVGPDGLELRTMASTKPFRMMLR
jgi:hypothetical protein